MVRFVDNEPVRSCGAAAKTAEAGHQVSEEIGSLIDAQRQSIDDDIAVGFTCAFVGALNPSPS
ncbi:hypothetical protein, partial [Mesorhizobium sp. P5_C1]